MSYYYLGATLPMLFLDTAPAMSLDQFLDECGRHLSPVDAIALRELLEPENDDTRTAFTRRWRIKENMVRNAAARSRATAGGTSADASLEGSMDVDPFIEQAVSDAFMKTNPLLRERALDELRWALIDEAIGHDSFAIDALLGYALKLKLVERWAGMDHSRAAERLQQIVQAEPESTDPGE